MGGRLPSRAGAARAPGPRDRPRRVHSVPGEEERHHMRKVELVARIAAATDVTNTQAAMAVETILATIKEALH